MDLITAVSILNQQVLQLYSLLNQLQNQSVEMQELMSRENSIAAIEPQVHSLTGSMSIIMTSVGSETALVQQAIDRVAELSA